jgi:hypothetical protein
VVPHGLIASGPRRLILRDGGTTRCEAAAKRSWKEASNEKLAVFVVVAAMAMFIPGAMASADDHEGKTNHGESHEGKPTHHGIEGVYAVTGFSSCSPATTPGIFEADYTFSRDGTGSAQAISRGINASGGGFSTFTADFTYEVTHEGRITFDYHGVGNKVVKTDPVTNEVLWEVTWDRGPGHGVISPDGQTITITCGPPVVLQVVESTNVYLPKGTTTSCVTTAVGMRLK